MLIRQKSIVISLEKLRNNVNVKISFRTQANYLLWRAAAASVSYLTEELRKRQLQYSTIVTGKTERAARWKECIDVTSGRYYSDLLQHFKTEPTTRVLYDEDTYVHG